MLQAMAHHAGGTFSKLTYKQLLTMFYLAFFSDTPVPVFVTLALVFVTCKQKKTVKFHLHTFMVTNHCLL